MRKIFHIPINREVPPSLPNPVLTGVLGMAVRESLEQPAPEPIEAEGEYLRDQDEDE